MQHSLSPNLYFHTSIVTQISLKVKSHPCEWLLGGQDSNLITGFYVGYVRMQILDCRS
jgi:hypothetical protein